MWARVSAIIFQLLKVIMLEKCVLTILELNWNQRLGHRKTKLNICHHMPTSSTQLQNRSFHVVERTRTSTKCQKMKNARAKRAKILFFIVNYANLWGFCCRRRRGCLSSLIRSLSTRRSWATLGNRKWAVSLPHLHCQRRLVWKSARDHCPSCQMLTSGFRPWLANVACWTSLTSFNITWCRPCL